MVRIGLVALAAGLLSVSACAQTRIAPDGPSTRALTEARIPDALALYRDFLRLPNDAQHPEDLGPVLDWLEVEFAKRGFTVRRLETEGLPLLLAERPAPGASKTALIYLQTDGQPVDPAAWDQASPWEPQLKTAQGEPLAWSNLRDRIDPDWRIYARSAADSKGPIVQFLAAIDAIDDGRVAPGAHFKVVVDAEEELGSPNLPSAVKRHREALAADFLWIFDGPPHASNAPTLKFGARGIATLTLTVFGPKTAQHSGHYGNFVPNPAERLARALASLQDDDGKVTIPGFYDGVTIDAEAQAVLDATPDDEAAILAAMGVAAPEAVAPSLQAAIQYPSLNVRGLKAAWVGPEARTVIPDRAVAELDLRLVQESDPERLVGLIRAHIASLGYHLVEDEPTDADRARHPKLARLDARIAYPAFRTDFDSLPGQVGVAALTRLNGEAPIRIRTSGGSVPISPFVNTLGIPAVGVPTVNIDNNQHSPNENIRLGSFIDGIATLTAVLTQPIPE
ncbi:MAG: M20/M25/M40 family metallo-hydrolase [Maricaulaceae bacterium]